MEMMEWNEKVADLDSKDQLEKELQVFFFNLWKVSWKVHHIFCINTISPQKWANLLEKYKIKRFQTVQTSIDKELASLGKAFNEKKLEAARPILTKLSYLYSLKHTIDKRIEDSLKN